jgi:hypothetical protein
VTEVKESADVQKANHAEFVSLVPSVMVKLVSNGMAVSKLARNEMGHL